ncbi:Protein of unknown function (DUF3723) domain containing protein, partial [Rhypophila sp. PSN 637]
MDFKRAKKLAVILRNSRYEPSEPQHQISGLVSEKTLETILQSAQLSREELVKKNQSHYYPLIRGDFRIWCFRGRRRILAALIAFGRHSEITVKLYCKTEVARLRRFIRDEGESFLHEADYYDGEIYWNIREYEKDPIEVSKWRDRLKSDSKKKHLALLLGRKQIVDALDRLRPYPGLWFGLKLGNIHRHLATHLDERIAYHFSYIADVWDFITNDDNDLKDAVDCETVQLVQFRAPLASRSDRALISEAIDRGAIFSRIGDRRVRAGLKQRLLSQRHIIPSIATYDTNMNYIAIGAKIVSEHIEVRPKATFRKPVTTMYENLSHQWKSPPQMLVEVEEGLFRPTRGTPSLELAFIALFLQALRDFPSLCGEKPLQDFRGEKTEFGLNQYSVKRLCQRAYILGFYNAKIERGLQIPNNPTPVSSSERRTLLLSDWRGGKPFVQTFLDLQRTSYLPNLLRTSPDNSLTPAYVQRDIIRAFF